MTNLQQLKEGIKKDYRALLESFNINSVKPSKNEVEVESAVEHFIDQIIDRTTAYVLEEVKLEKAICKRTRRGAWIVEYNGTHATFGELKKAREFCAGYNQARQDISAVNKLKE